MLGLVIRHDFLLKMEVDLHLNGRFIFSIENENRKFMGYTCNISSLKVLIWIASSLKGNIVDYR